MMQGRYHRLFLVIMLCVAVSGCAIHRVNFNTEIVPEDLSFVTAGETTLHSVVVRLGAPEDITSTADQLIAEYRWSTTRSSSLNLGYLFKIISPISPPMTLSGTGINIQRLLIICDDRLIVRSYAFGLTHEHALVEFWPF
jgi:hypothetical protein